MQSEMRRRALRRDVGPLAPASALACQPRLAGLKRLSILLLEAEHTLRY